MVYVKKQVFEVVKYLVKDEKMTVKLVTRKDKQYVLREFTNYDDYFEALFRYKTLVKSGIYVPKLLKKDKKSFKLLFEYIIGQDCAEALSKYEIKEEYFAALYLLYRFCRVSKIELNYLPENFIYDGKRMFYISLDLFEQNSNINLENYGMEYWFTSVKGIEHLEKLGYSVNHERQISVPEVNKKIVLISIKHW